MWKTENHSVYTVLLDFVISLIAAHNPKVTGSSPVPATKSFKPQVNTGGFLFFAQKVVQKRFILAFLSQSNNLFLNNLSEIRSESASVWSESIREYLVVTNHMSWNN